MFTISDLLQIVFIIIVVTLIAGMVISGIDDVIKAKRKRGKKK